MTLFKLFKTNLELRKFSFLDVWSAHVAVWGNETSKFKKSINSQETKLHLKVIIFKYLQVSYQLKIVFSPSEIRHKKGKCCDRISTNQRRPFGLLHHREQKVQPLEISTDQYWEFYGSIFVPIGVLKLAWEFQPDPLRENSNRLKTFVAPTVNLFMK